MGAWEITNFANDTAMDWISDFEENSSVSFLLQTILAVFEDEYLDSDIASEALAAIEVVAAAKGRPASDFPEEIGAVQLASLAASIDAKVIETCKKSIHRIIKEEDNELFELWEESDQGKDWVTVQKDLLSRVG